MAAAGSGPGDRLLGDADKLTVPERAVYMVFLTVFVDTLAASISTPMMPYYARSFGVSTAAVGWLYGAWSFSSTVFAPILSRTADKWGRRPILVASLVGAGVANLVQGCAPCFSVFLFGRFFSGIWAAVGSTCSVYVTDVAPESVRPSYLSKLALVPLLALLFGPGLGGGLAKLGLNVPILVDAWLTLFSAAVVAYYLPETPAFLAARLARKQSLEDGLNKAPDAKEPAKGTTGKVPPVVHLLGLANFLGGFSFSTLLSTFAIFMAAKYSFDPLHVGFSFVGNAVIMMLTNVWGVPFLHGRLSVFQCWALGSVLQGFSYMAFSLAPTVWTTLALYGVGGVGMSIRNANGGTITASFTQTDNRAKIFSYIQTYSNFGRMVGPIVSTHLAQVWLPLPFILAGTMSILSAVVVSWAELQKPGPAATPPPEPRALQRKATIFGGEWEDDVGTAEDKRRLGEFMGELLTKKHYRWVSRREEVEALLDRVLPDLETSDREVYQSQLASIAKYE